MRLLVTYILIAQCIVSCGQNQDYGKSLVEAINSPDEAKRRQIIESIFSESALTSPGLDPIMGVINRWHSTYTPLEFHHSEINEFPEPTGTKYSLHVYARKKGETMYKDFQIHLSWKSPHKLERITFIADVAEPVNLPNGSIDQSYTLQWLNSYVDKLKDENDLYGSYRILKGNQILFERQIGFEDVDKKKPISSNTGFNLASGGKMFTAVAIAQLVEAGKLKYNDPVTNYINGFSDIEKSNKIKISNLLSHTSGIGHYWTGQNDQAVFSATTTNEHLKLVYQAGFDFDAGTKYEYNNSNFIVLGAIIEKVTNQSYYDYVQQNIFDKANMTATGYFGQGTDGVATPLAQDEKSSWIKGKHGMKGSSAGGAYSTLTDIQKFSIALRDNTLIRKESLQEMITQQNKGLSSEMYGYGFLLMHRSGTFGYGHGGTADGVNFEFDYFPNQDVTLIMFCNQNNGAYDDLKKNIIKLITEDR